MSEAASPMKSEILAGSPASRGAAARQLGWLPIVTADGAAARVQLLGSDASTGGGYARTGLGEAREERHHRHSGLRKSLSSSWVSTTVAS